jgi:hypothetical protein
MDAVALLSTSLLILFVLLFALILYKFHEFYRAKKLIKSDYGVIAAFCFFILGSIVCILGHIGYGLFIIIFIGLVCLIVSSAFAQEKGRARVEAAEIEAIKKVDVFESIRFKDFFSGYCLILKLNRKYGARKALVIQIFVSTGIFVVLWVLLIFLMNALIVANVPRYNGGWSIYVAEIGPLLSSIFFMYNSNKKMLKKAKTLSSPQIVHLKNFCTNCGVPVTPENTFCPNCGK